MQGCSFYIKAGSVLFMDNIKNIKWLYLARLASLTGSQILFFAVPLLIFKLTHSVAYSGIAFSLEWTARIISFPLSGYCADKFGSKRVYVLTDLIIGVLCTASILLMTIFHDAAFIILILLAVSAGFLSEQGYVSAESLAPKLVSAQYYPKSQSILELLELMALLFGPTLTGIFILYFKIESLIWVAMSFYIFSALMMKQINVESHKAPVEIKLLKNLSAGFHTIYKHNYLINLVFLSMIANMLFGLMTGSAPVMVIGIYEKPDRFYALLNLAAGVFGIAVIISFNYLLKYISIIHIGIATFLMSCISCILLGFSHNYYSYLFVYAFFYGVNGLFSIFFRSERARIIPKELLGRTIGAIIFITFLLFPLSGLLISVSQKLFGLQSLIMFFGILCLLLGIPVIKKIHRLGFNS